MTRRSPSDAALAPLRPEFALPLVEAVMHATYDAAWASWAAHRLGVLRPGAFADVIVLDRDPAALGPDALLQARVMCTMSGSRIVHDARI